METTLKIKIENIKVSIQGWYSFDWLIIKDNKKKKGNYDSSYSNQSANTMRRKLKNGFAVELAVSQFFGF